MTDAPDIAQLAASLSAEAQRALREENFGWDDACTELLDAELVEYDETFNEESGDEFGWWWVTEMGRAAQQLLAQQAPVDAALASPQTPPA